MKLSCALVLTLTNFVIASPFSFGVKGSGTKVDPASATFGTFGLVQPVSSKTGYLGTLSKSSSANFASSSASESSGSFSYNAAQGTPSVAFVTGPSFAAPAQGVGLNAAVTPQAFTTAAPLIYNTGSSENTGAPAYYFSKEENKIPVPDNTPSKVQTVYKPDINLGYNPSAFVSQDISKPNTFLSTGSTVNPGISSSLSSQYVSSNQANTHAASSVQAQATPIAEQKPLYSGGFGGPPGVLSPYDKASVTGAAIPASNLNQPQYVSSIPVSNINTASNVPVGQQPGIYLGSTSQVSGTQGNPKPTTLVSGLPAYNAVSDSYKGVNDVQVNTDTAPRPQHQHVAIEQKPVNCLGSIEQTSVSQDISNPKVYVTNVESKAPENVKKRFEVFSESSEVNSGAIASVPTTQSQAAPIVEQKPVYSSGFGGPQGVLSPYDKASDSGVATLASKNPQNLYHQNTQLYGSVSTTPQDFSYTSPSSELKPYEDIQSTVDSKPVIQLPKKPEVSVEYPSQTVKPGNQITNQAYLYPKETSQASLEVNQGHISESLQTLEQSKKPLYTGGFGAPAGVLEPIQPTVSDVQKFVSTTFKPGQYEESKPTVGYTPTVTEVNKYSSISGELKPTEAPHFENVEYQSNVGSSPASYVTFKPTGSISHSEQDASNIGVYSTAGTVSAIEQKDEGQKVTPTFSTWEQSPTQAPISFVQTPETVAPVKPAVQIFLQNKPIFPTAPATFTTSQPPSYSYPFEGKNPTSPIPQEYVPSSVYVTKETKPNFPVVSTNQYESSQSVTVADQVEDKKNFNQVNPTGGAFIASSAAPTYKPEQTFAPIDKTKPSSVWVTSQKEVGTVSEVPSDLSEQIKEKEIISPSFGAVKPTGSQNSAVYSSTGTGFVSVSQQSTNKPSFEEPLEKIPASAYSGNPLTTSHANKPSISYVQKETQKPSTEVIDKETPSKVSVFDSTTYSDKIGAQFSKNPTEAIPDTPSYSSSFGTLTGSTGYKPSNSGQYSTTVTGSKDKVSQINFGTTVKPFVKPELSVISQQTSVSTSSASQNTDKQIQTDSTLVQNKPTVTTSERQQFTNQAFTANSAAASGTTAFNSKLQYQLPTIQPAVQKNPWYTNSFGTFGTAKPYNFYPGFTSSVTTYGQDSNQDKTKQTTQINSSGQYIPYPSGQYKPYTTGQYKPYNWGIHGNPSYSKFSNVYPTGGTFVSTYAPTTFKPFVTSSLFDKSKSSGIFAVTNNKESNYVNGFGSQFSVTTAKPSWLTQTQTPYKPAQEPSVSNGSSETPKDNKVVVPQKFEASITKPTETEPKKSSQLSLDSGYLGTSSFGQSYGSTVKPTVNLLAPSAQSEIKETVKPFTQSPSKDVYFNTNNAAEITAQVTKLSESSFGSAPVSQINPFIQPFLGSPVVKPSNPSASQIKVEEKVQYSQTLKPESSKITVQPFLTPTQVDEKKPSSFSTFNTGPTTSAANEGSIQSVLSNANEGNSGVQLSSVEKWSVTPIPVVTQKPEYLNSFQQSSGQFLTSSPSVLESDSATVSGSKVTLTPISATGNPQYVAYDTPGKPVFQIPNVQVSTSEKKPAVAVSYKEKDSNEASLVGNIKPTIPSEYSTNVNVASKYTDGPAKVPTSFIYSTQIPTKTNQQTLGVNSDTGASPASQTSYVGGFGGPPGILKPNDYSSLSQQQYVQTQYKPSYNNQAEWANQQYRPSGVNSNTASQFGGYGTTSGVLAANENIKPNDFSYAQNVNKYITNVQAQKGQNAVFESQAFVHGPSNAAVGQSTGGHVSNHHGIQNPFNGGLSAGTGYTTNDFKLTGQFSGTKAFGAAQRSTVPGVVASLL